MARRFATLDAWLAWQESLHPRTIDLGLERVRGVAQALGIGAFRCPVVTVGGTNGKGSCVALLEAILAAAGWRVGTFTSPHLHRYNERIRVRGVEIGDEALMEAFERIDRARGEVSLTFFEFNTLAALLALAAEPLDAVILEVGLGGRLDAVNIVDADVALLTSIGLDHTDWLGTTLESIGREKAGIFRAGRPAVLGSARMPGSVFEVAAEIGASLRLPGVDFSVERGPESWSWRGRTLRFDALPFPALAGAHQVDNAAAAIAVLEALAGRLPFGHDAVAEGLRRAMLHGRIEIAPGEIEWIFDVAHNPEAAERLAETLRQRPVRGRTLAVVGILKDKDAPGVVAPLRAQVSEWIAAGLEGPRGTSGEALRDLCRRDGERWSAASSVAEACERAAHIARPGDRVIVFGSFYTVGPALEWRRTLVE